MLEFRNGVIVEGGDNEECLSFKQLKGMITTGQWIELLRTFIRDNPDDVFINDIFDDKDYLSTYKDRFYEVFNNIINNNSEIRKSIEENKKFPLALFADVEGYIENNWEYIAEYYYNKENKYLLGSIIYMMTFADGEEAVKCIGYYN